MSIFHSLGRLFDFVMQCVGWLLAVLLTVWAAGALHFDLAPATLRWPVAIAYVVAVLGAMARLGRWRAVGAAAFAGLLVLVAWLTIQPSNDRKWQDDVAKTPWAEINGDQVILQNVRNCEYRTGQDFTARWETRTLDLTKLRGVDLFINYRGSPTMAHPMLSFDFGNQRICASIETRKQGGESYSAIGGIYRQYELIYVFADERDVVRVRTNFRQGEDVYLYHTRIRPEQARETFLEYLKRANELHERPAFYHALTSNCTTNVRVHAKATTNQPAPWDWRLLVNGFADEMLYERKAIVGELPFAEMKKQALINPAAKAAGNAPDFSARIRANRVGF